MGRNVVIVIVLGFGLTYLGVVKDANATFDRYGTLAQLQSSRSDLAESGKSGFASDVDVSTTEGALNTIPIGLTYLMLAPFPWEATSLRSTATIPEVLVWWAMLPFVFYGLVWALKNRLRSVFPIALFALFLSIGYSVFQGNVGTAYRQRTQIQVFLFMFGAVGWSLRKEKKENKEMLREAQKRRFVEAAKRNAALRDPRVT
jgi:hypothetical protein